MKRIKFITFGCKVNQYETEALLEEFKRYNFEIVDNKEADLYIINSCSVTKNADKKSIETIFRIRKQNPQAKICLCGCLVELNRDELERLGIDYLIPQREKHNLVNIILNQDNKRSIWDLYINDFFNHRAFIKIQDGCNHYCSFCKIPYIRGNSRSRDKQDVLTEVKRLSLTKYEIVLCGINLGLYGKDFPTPYSLTDLVNDILKILPPQRRLRLSSLEPNLIDDRLVKIFYDQRMCPHLHLPFQSGDDMVLKRMNKQEDVSLYKNLVKKLREINPDIAISCDIMVGFPYETKNSFYNTYKFIQEIKPMRIHIFTFSPREKTPLYKSRLIKKEIIRERYNLLKQLGEKLSYEYKRRFIGRKLNVVLEEIKGEYICGYSENYLKIYILPKHSQTVHMGNLAEVKITRITKDNRLIGELI